MWTSYIVVSVLLFLAVRQTTINKMGWVDGLDSWGDLDQSLKTYVQALNLSILNTW